MKAPVMERQRWHDRSRNAHAPLWLRVVAYAEAKSGPNGHAPLTAGELRGLDNTISASSWSRAINAAVKSGWLDERSSARCLVLPGAGMACCAIHRGGQ